MSNVDEKITLFFLYQILTDLVLYYNYFKSDEILEKELLKEDHDNYFPKFFKHRCLPT